MAYIAMGFCCSCGNPVSFNPDKVPSIRVNGAREPVCKTCIDKANPLRKQAGLPEIKYAPDAYEPVAEETDTDYIPEPEE